ncbi:MAG: aspartyl/asparaginyl beta-hydroxylase domain-containing protein [Betaproteobacteria bacterium]|nr:aspartyl/asparaginyl beta-hydroxylase domain-containing protein [Betaproteobacteria bacterium]
MTTNPFTPEDIESLHAQARQMMQRGDAKGARHLCKRIVEHQPDHAGALAALGEMALREGDSAEALRWLQAAAGSPLAGVEPHISLALACRQAGDAVREEQAIKQALARDPTHLLALMLKADYLERAGDRHEAALAYGAVIDVAPPVDRLHPELRAGVLKAFQYQDQYNREFGAFIDARLDDLLRDLPASQRDRFAESVDIMIGRKKRYESRSMVYHYPGLLPVPFLPRERFPWLDAFEQATDAIRDECAAVLARDQGLEPYLTYPEGAPLNQFAELNNSKRWSAYHLIKGGKVLSDHAANCATTLELLKTAPQPDQPGRTPAAMFSLLHPRTRIPAHVGVTNSRLVVHLPLIIPGRCGFRVGNATREWQLGKAWVFDDTIEHEAWNLSDQLRAILIFDIWHPDIPPEERSLITALMAGINAFKGEDSSFAL